MLVENLPVPFDRRVWMESRTLADAGYAVSVICPLGRTGRLHETLDGIHIYRYPLPSLPGFLGHVAEYGIALPATALLSLVVLVRHGFDVLHSANPPDLFFLIALLYKPFGKKFVFDHHDLVPETCLTRWGGLKQRVMYRVSLWLERATFAAADTVISTNESYRAVAIARGAKDPSRVIVVRSGPSLARFVRVAPEPALKDGFAHLVCYLGVMGPNDGLDHLLDAAAHVVHDRGRADVLFVLIGSGDCHPRLVARAAELNLVRNVRFVGRIPDQDVIRYLSTADVGVAPDPKDPLNDLSTMNKILEYMAVGLPVAAFDLVEARVSAGEAGAYARASDPAALGDLVLDLIADPARRQRMGDAGLRRFRDSLAWEHQAPRLLGAYSMLLGRTPAPVRSVV